jgi:hypothetical protein
MNLHGFLNKRKELNTEYAVIFFFIILFGCLGVYLQLGSHASTPYASLNANQGTLANGAVVKSDSSASDGYSVLFDTSNSGGGGNTGSGNNMVAGLNTADYGPSTPATEAESVKYIRLDEANGESANDYAKVGIKVDLDFSGPYTTNGISSINANTWASNAVASYKSLACTTTECPSIEVLNEPGGTWFWGSNALSTTNAEAYAALVKATYIAFHNAYGSSSPLILATFDGAYGSVPSGVNLLPNEQFGYEWWSSSMSQYVDGIVVHPYGGTGTASQARLGNRTSVTDAYEFTHKPMYVTEVGWPTDDSGTVPTTVNDTGDSLQWPASNSAGANQGDQCDNVYNFISWARSTNYVNAVYIFQLADYGSNDFYGMFTTDMASAKPAFTALKSAANLQSNPCPKPLAY